MIVVVCLKIGEQILTIAVLSIIITAPLGAIAILALGPVLLDTTDTIVTRMEAKEKELEAAELEMEVRALEKEEEESEFAETDMEAAGSRAFSVSTPGQKDVFFRNQLDRSSQLRRTKKKRKQTSRDETQSPKSPLS